LAVFQESLHKEHEENFSLEVFFPLSSPTVYITVPFSEIDLFNAFDITNNLGHYMLIPKTLFTFISSYLLFLLPFSLSVSPPPIVPGTFSGGFFFFFFSVYQSVALQGFHRTF